MSGRQADLMVVDRKTHSLDRACSLQTGTIPDRILPTAAGFEQLWQLHPINFHEIRMRGRLVKTPRWQQAYGADHHYTGGQNSALPLPRLISPYLLWCATYIDERINSALVNWYDGEKNHYIGRHRDKIKNMAFDSPIVTISLGDSRVLRMRPWKGRGYKDFRLKNGTVVIIPAETNLSWTHEVPAFASEVGRRISITCRAIENT